MKARADSRNPGFTFKSRRRGGGRRRKCPNRDLRHLDVTKTPMRRKTNACFPKGRTPNIGASPRSPKLAKAWIPALRARLPTKNGEPRKGRGRDRKTVPPTTARAPAGMTVRLKIRGSGEPRKPKAGIPKRNKTKPGFRLSARACRQKTTSLEKAAGEIEKPFLRQPRALRPE